jgi:transposase
MEATQEILGLGIDISKKRADICLKNSTVLDRFQTSNDEQGIASLLRRLEPHVKSGFTVKGAIESTGNLWIKIYEALERNGVDISLANPLKTRAIAEARIKSDKLDSTILADLARTDLVARCYVPDRNSRDIRALVRYRIDLAERSTQVKNKVHNILDKYSLRCDGEPFSKGWMEWLGAQTLGSVDRQLVDSHIREIAMLDELMQGVEKQMASLAVNDRRVDLLLGFTGIDYYGALLLLYEIGDVKRFYGPKKLVSWAGLAPSLHQSGDTRYTGRITKQGNKRVRWYLTEAAKNAARFDPKLRPFYERVASRKGNHKATIAVARKMLVSIYWVLTRNEHYDGDRQEVRERKVKKLERLLEQ